MRRKRTPVAGRRQRLANEHGRYRQMHREEDERLGGRQRDEPVMMRQIMWARWVEVAVTNELEARSHFQRFLVEPESDALTAELRSSLVAITATAHTIEALYGDIKYLIPPPTRRGDSRDQRIAGGLSVAFGLTPDQRTWLRERLTWLGDLRNFAVHPYTEDEAPRPHPAGVRTSSEAALFNAVECGKVLDFGFDVLAIARHPPSSHDRWITRWAEDREAYYLSVVDPLAAQRASANQVP